MGEAPHRRRADDGRGLAADLDRFGFCVAEGVLGGGDLARARGAVERAAQAQEAAARPAAPDGGDGEEPARRDGDRWVLLIAGECGLDDLVAHPLALALARHLLGRRVQLSGFAAHAVDPGNRTMALHTDQWWLPPPAMPGEPPRRPGDATRAGHGGGGPGPARGPISPAAAINVMWALTDFTAGNGCTRLVPGSHLSGCGPPPGAGGGETVGAVTDAEPEPAFAEVAAGGIVAWDARIWHASGGNRSAAPRIGISATYCGPQFRQLQNHALALTPDAQAALSDEMRELLGFRLFSSYGATDDYRARFARPGYERARGAGRGGGGWWPGAGG